MSGSSSIGRARMTLNAPLFEGVVDNNALVRGSWGAAPGAGLEPRQAIHRREDAHERLEGTRLSHPARRRRDVIINTGAWTNMCRAHRRTGADKGLLRGAPGGLLLDHERRLAQRRDHYGLQNVAGRHQGRRGDRGAWLNSIRRVRSNGLLDLPSARRRAD